MLEKEIISPALYLLWVFSIAVALLYSIDKYRILDDFSKIIAFLTFGLVAFRSDEFPDYSEYLEIYRITTENGFFDIFNLNLHGEVGFKLIILFLDKIFDNPLSIFLISAFASFVLLILVAKRLNLSFSQVWIGYFSFFFLTKDLGQIRYSVASLLVVYAYILSGIYGKMVFAIVASFFFQYFSFFPILVLRVIRGIRCEWSVMFGLMLIAIGGSFFLSFDFLTFIGPEKITDNYYGTDYVSGSIINVLPAVFRSLLVCLFVSYSVRGHRLSAIERDLVIAIPVSIFFYVVFWQVPIVSQRIGGFFASVIPFVLVIAVQKNVNKLMLFLYFILCTASFNALYFSVSYL